MSLYSFWAHWQFSVTKIQVVGGDNREPIMFLCAHTFSKWYITIGMSV